MSEIKSTEHVKFGGSITTELGGQQRTLRFGINALNMMTQELDIKDNDISKLFSIGMSALPTFIYCGLYADYRSRKADVDFDKWDVGDWLDDLGMERMEGLFTEIGKVFSNSMPEDLKKKAAKLVKEKNLAATTS